MQRGTMGRIVSGVPVCLLTLAVSSTPALAFDLGQWVPGLKVSPFLSERVEYESNIFQTPSHSKDDVIFKTIPGILADYTFGPHSISAGYRAEILRYLDLTDQDTVHHIAVGQLRLDFPRTLLTLKDDFTRTQTISDYLESGFQRKLIILSSCMNKRIQPHFGILIARNLHRFSLCQFRY